jgi:hypothetical protein
MLPSIEPESMLRQFALPPTKHFSELIKAEILNILL